MAAPQGNKKAIVLLLILASLGICLAVITRIKDPRLYLGFFYSRSYQLIILLALASAFCLLLIRWLFHRHLPYKIIKLFFGFIFLPLLILPIFRCYFKVPYVFCRACLNKCPWGIARTFVFSGFVLLNLSGKFWCTGLCPFRVFQEWEAQVLKPNFKLPSWLRLSVYLMLGLTFAAYLLTLLNPDSAVVYFGFGLYAWSSITLSAVSLIIFAGIFISKFFCRYICPVGTIEELTFAIKTRVKK